MPWTEVEQYSFFAEYLQGMRTGSIGIYSYYCYYVFRRAALAVTLVYLYEYTSQVIHIFLMLILLALLHHAIMKNPFDSKTLCRLEYICEFVLYVACIIQITTLHAFNP